MERLGEAGVGWSETGWGRVGWAGAMRDGFGLGLVSGGVEVGWSEGGWGGWRWGSVVRCDGAGSCRAAHVFAFTYAPSLPLGGLASVCEPWRRVADVTARRLDA